jgi:hypothetical protein
MATKFQTERNYIETGAEPEFFVTHTRTEAASGGNVRIFCYSERHKNEFQLLYIAVVPAKELAEIARRGLAASVGCPESRTVGRRRNSAVSLPEKRRFPNRGRLRAIS